MPCSDRDNPLPQLALEIGAVLAPVAAACAPTASAESRLRAFAAAWWLACERGADPVSAAVFASLDGLDAESRRWVVSWCLAEFENLIVVLDRLFATADVWPCERHWGIPEIECANDAVSLFIKGRSPAGASASWIAYDRRTASAIESFALQALTLEREWTTAEDSH